MANNHVDATIRRLLDRRGRTFAEELNIHVEQGTPSPLFQLLCFALVGSTRIGWQTSLHAARALFDAGWTTPAKMADATWRQRTDVLNKSGYARYDESTSRMLEDSARLLLEKYQGDLRKLREQAGRDREEERRRVKEFKGIGDVGADIFFREVQGVWDEWHPFMDRLAVEAAAKLELPKDPRVLAEHVGRAEFPRLVAALVRTHLEDLYAEMTAEHSDQRAW
ncbi:MAG: hypothetical protein WD294_04155 [Phycisphaeraceae bacterium]